MCVKDNVLISVYVLHSIHAWTELTNYVGKRASSTQGGLKNQLLQLILELTFTNSFLLVVLTLLGTASANLFPIPKPPSRSSRFKSSITTNAMEHSQLPLRVCFPSQWPMSSARIQRLWVSGIGRLGYVWA